MYKTKRQPNMKTQASVLILLTMMAPIALSKKNMSKYGEQNQFGVGAPDCGNTDSCMIYTQPNGKKLLTYLTAGDPFTWKPWSGTCTHDTQGTNCWSCGQDQCFTCPPSGIYSLWPTLPTATKSRFPVYTCLVPFN